MLCHLYTVDSELILRIYSHVGLLGHYKLYIRIICIINHIQLQLVLLAIVNVTIVVNICCFR